MKWYVKNIDVYKETYRHYTTGYICSCIKIHLCVQFIGS